jgi:hypothetical protein
MLIGQNFPLKVVGSHSIGFFSERARISGSSCNIYENCDALFGGSTNRVAELFKVILKYKQILLFCWGRKMI